MKRPTWLMLLGLCCILSLPAVGCRRGGDADEVVSPEPVESPLEEEITAETPTTDPDSPETEESPAPETSPETRPTQQPQAGQGTAITPPKPAQLIADQPSARINLRSQPTTASQSKGYGLVGDPVQLLRTTQGGDGYDWYYVKFEQSGAEGWIRGDFINIEGRATPLPAQVNTGNQCEGLLEVLTFTAYYDSSGQFNLIRLQNLETNNTFDAALSPQVTTTAAQTTYTGNASPPTGGTYPITVTDLSGGNPGNGSQVSVNYSGITGTGTCN
jgi:hypothetical protein